MRTIRSSIKHGVKREASSCRAVLPTTNSGDDGDTSAGGMPKSTEKSLDYLWELFRCLSRKENLQVIATRMPTSPKDSCITKGCMVAFKQYHELVNLVNAIAANYIVETKPVLTSDSVATRYEGSCSVGGMSYLEVSDALVSESWNKFKAVVRDVDREENPASCNPNAIIFTSSKRDFFLISIQNPVTTFKHRSMFLGKRMFSKIKDGELLTLSHQIDAVAFKDTIVFFTSRGASYFVDESAVQKKAGKTAAKIVSLNLVSNNKMFLEAVKVSRNAHWLLAVGAKRLEKIMDRKIQKEVAKVFHLKYSDGRFSTETKGEIASFLKVLGKQGMLDVVENVPMEVSIRGHWTTNKEK